MMGDVPNLPPTIDASVGAKNFSPYFALAMTIMLFFTLKSSI